MSSSFQAANSRSGINSIGINPGQFRHRITLLEPTLGTDASGVVATYAPADPPLKAWAKIEGLRSEGQVQSGQDISSVYLKITIRYNPAFQAQKAIQRWNGNQYVIEGTPENVLELGAYMVLTCRGIGLNS
jgi:SPP1 family predicted phage head-tail adaptor